MVTIRIVFISVLLLTFIGKNSSREITRYDAKGYTVSYFRGNGVIYWLVFLVLAGVAGCRTGFVDTQSYLNLYEQIGTDFSMVIGDQLRVERGFRFLCYVLNHVSRDPQFFLMVVSGFITLSFFVFINRYSLNRWNSALLFLMTIYLTTMNTLRQYIVVACLLLAIPLIQKGKWWLFVIIAACLMSIHTTAIIAGISFVLCRGKFLNKKVCLIIIVAIILALTPAGRFLEILQATDIHDYAEVFSLVNKGGVNLLRLAVQCVPVILAQIYIKIHGADSLDDEFSMFANLSILNFLVYILSTKSNYLARLAIYFDVFNIILIPFFLSLVIRKDQVRLANTIALSLYAVYFYYAVNAFGAASVDMLTPFFIGGR